MIKCVVIADDLTGANATGVQLKKLDYNTSTIMNIVQSDLDKIDDCECVTFTTDSRGIDSEIAYNRVFNILQMFDRDKIEIFCKRVDSTLRGNLGSETDAALDALGEDYTAIAVPCAPASGRVTIGGYMQVNGVLLHKTEAALDPKTPILDSRVAKLFEKQSKYPVASILMEDLDQGKVYITKKINNLIAEGIRIIVFDSLTQEDIDLISEAVIDSKIKFVAVDPGAFTATLAQKLIVPEECHAQKKILAVVGSVNPVAKAQMEAFWLAQPVYNVFAKTKCFVEGAEKRQAEIDRLVKEVLDNRNHYDLFSVTVDGINPEYRLDFPTYAKALQISVDDVSELINYAMAEVAYRLLKEDPTFGGLYTSGGDITAAVCKRCTTVGLNLKDEVIPLAACGTFMEGEFPGTYIVTKGGMTGGPDAINICIAKLKAMLNM